MLAEGALLFDAGGQGGRQRPPRRAGADRWPPLAAAAARPGDRPPLWTGWPPAEQPGGRRRSWPAARCATLITRSGGTR